MIWTVGGKRFYKVEILRAWHKAKSFKTETRPSLVAATLKVDSFKTDTAYIFERSVFKNRFHSTPRQMGLSSE